MARFSAGSGAQCVGDPGFNRDSVMMYEVPQNWTVGGVFSQPLNRDISARDRLCLSGIYKLSA